MWVSTSPEAILWNLFITQNRDQQLLRKCSNHTHAFNVLRNSPSLPQAALGRICSALNTGIPNTHQLLGPTEATIMADQSDFLFRKLGLRILWYRDQTGPSKRHDAEALFYNRSRNPMFKEKSKLGKRYWESCSPRTKSAASGLSQRNWICTLATKLVPKNATLKFCLPTCPQMQKAKALQKYSIMPTLLLLTLVSIKKYYLVKQFVS